MTLHPAMSKSWTAAQAATLHVKHSFKVWGAGAGVCNVSGALWHSSESCMLGTNPGVAKVLTEPAWALPLLGTAPHSSKAVPDAQHGWGSEGVGVAEGAPRQSPCS